MKGPTWKKSLPGFALLALLGGGGELTGGEQPAKSTVPPKMENRPAESRKWSGVHKIREKLGQIVLEQVRYDGLPLGEVVRQLMEESRRRDPDKTGINFLLINSTPSAIIDPATGLPVPQEPVDIGSITVRIEPGLWNVRLLDALDAIIKVADRPLRYSIQDYGVVFSLDPSPGLSEALVTETFQVQADIFFRGIESAFGIEVPADSTSGSTPRSTVAQLWALKLKQAEDDLKETKELAHTGLVSSTEVRRAENAVETARLQLVAKEEEAQKRGNTPLPNRETQQRIFRELFLQLGVRLEPPRTAFFNDLTGIMMVRVSPSEMEAVRAAIETLGGTPTSKLPTTNLGKAQ